jgi:hypothetical protein
MQNHILESTFRKGGAKVSAFLLDFLLDFFKTKLVQLKISRFWLYLFLKGRKN